MADIVFGCIVQAAGTQPEDVDRNIHRALSENGIDEAAKHQMSFAFGNCVSREGRHEHAFKLHASLHTTKLNPELPWVRQFVFHIRSRC